MNEMSEKCSLSIAVVRLVTGIRGFRKYYPQGITKN